MPAGSESAPALPRLPHTFRPLGVRMAVYLFGGLLVAVAVTIWVAFPAHTRAEFSVAELGTIAVLALGAAAVGYALARSRVVARKDGVTVVNGYKTRRFEWTQVIAVTMRPGSPWALLDLSDGTTVAAMGIQASDGGRAVRQLRQLRGLVEAHSATPHND
jgi:hypothetical protein